MLLFKVCFIPYSHYVVDLIKKLELGIMVVSDLPKFVCPKLVYQCGKQSVSTPAFNTRLYTKVFLIL